MKKLIIIIASLIIMTCNVYSESLVIQSFIAKKAKTNQLDLKFVLRNKSNHDIYLFANNIYYSSTTNTCYIENGFPTDKFMFICLNWTKNRTGSNPTMFDANHSPRLEYFPKCIKIKPKSKVLLEIAYLNDSNIEKMNPNQKYLIQSMLSYATSENWNNMKNAFSNVINKKAIIDKNRIKTKINFDGRVAKDGYAFENKELYNTKIKITKEQNIILDKNFDNHVYKTALIRFTKNRLYKKKRRR